MATDGRYDLLTKKEVIRLERERKHLQANLAGIKTMKRLPDALFIVDSNNEAIAVKEARKLGIPVVAVVDTNCDPSEVDFVIPGNDDALRAIRLFASKISDSAAEGSQLMTDKQVADLATAAAHAEAAPAASGEAVSYTHLHEFLEIVGAGHEIALAIDFHHDAELAAVVDVGADQPLFGDARSLLAGRRDATLAQ